MRVGRPVRRRPRVNPADVDHLAMCRDKGHPSLGRQSRKLPSRVAQPPSDRER